jgi:hypothetical protein
MCLLLRSCVFRTVSVFQSENHEGTCDRTSCPGHAHSAAKPCCYFTSYVTIEAKLLTKTAKCGLRAIESFFEFFYCFFSLCAHKFALVIFHLFLSDGINQKYNSQDHQTYIDVIIKFIFWDFTIKPATCRYCN